MGFRLSSRMKPIPKPSAFSNAQDPRLEVGTEQVLRYLANAHHVIDETKQLCSGYQLHDIRLEVDPDAMTPFPLYEEIGRQPLPPPPHTRFHIYVDPLVPTDPKIFVIYKVNAMIFWVMNIHTPTVRSPITQNPQHPTSKLLPRQHPCNE